MEHLSTKSLDKNQNNRLELLSTLSTRVVKPLISGHDDTKVQMKCAECESEEEEKIQMKPEVHGKTIAGGTDDGDGKISDKIQAKLEIGASDDKYEKEADDVADMVMRMPSSDSIQMKCNDCEEEQIQMSSNGISSEKSYASDKLAGDLNHTKGHGNALPENVSSEMGAKIGADFSRVKIHTDSSSVQMNRGLGARAFTHGNDIYFNQGQYSPESSNGKHLLAHELTHVVQQSNLHNELKPYIRNTSLIQRSCMDLASGNWRNPVCAPPPSPRSVGNTVETEIARVGGFSDIGDRLKEVKIPGANKAAMHNGDPIEDFGFADLIEVTARGSNFITVKVGEIKPLNQHGYIIGLEEAAHYRDKISDYGHQCRDLDEMEMNLPANRSIRGFCNKLGALENGGKEVRLDSLPFILWPSSTLNLPALIGDRDIEVHNCGNGSINYRCTESEEDSQESDEESESEPGEEQQLEQEDSHEEQQSDPHPEHQEESVDNQEQISCPVPEGCPSDFCRPYSSFAQALFYRSTLGRGILAGIASQVNTRVVPVWSLYLSGGSSLVDYTSQYGNDFTSSQRTGRVTDFLINALLENLRENPPLFPPNSDQLSFGLHSRIESEILEIGNPNSLEAMDFNITNEIPGNIAGGIGDNQRQCRSGARPSDNNDLRWVKEESTVQVIKNEDGSLRVTPHIQYLVIDTVDLCPGNCGNALEQLATTTLSRLEASGVSGDVPFFVNFPAPQRLSYTIVPRVLNNVESEGDTETP